jgi:hypothetical protein
MLEGASPLSILYRSWVRTVRQNVGASSAALEAVQVRGVFGAVLHAASTLRGLLAIGRAFHGWEFADPGHKMDCGCCSGDDALGNLLLHEFDIAVVTRFDPRRVSADKALRIFAYVWKKFIVDSAVGGNIITHNNTNFATIAHMAGRVLTIPCSFTRGF